MNKPSDAPSKRGEPAAATADATPADPKAAPTPKDPLDTLCQSARAGDRAAFDALVLQSYDRAYTIALNMLRSEPDARDVVQDAFVRVQRGLQDFQGNSKFTTWLYRVVVNLCLDAIRHKKRWGEKTPTELDTLPGRERNPEQDTADTELKRALAAGLQQLPEIHRATFLLFEVEGLSYEEIAKVTGVRVGTVMSRLFNARKKMQAFLSPLLGIEGSDTLKELKEEDE
ncbi:MAG: sigma-70 family RNA polymerase sigma factor [Deltaproteobacteria bacterium]|nr:sigma-70 family RNA polymerase sigma factor [Deltaproteobacteria bacterium]